MTESNDQPEYLLGVNQQELERLRFQQTVWGPVTRRFLQRLGLREGWRCLDVGAGPGLVTMELRESVGETGEVTALEPSALYVSVIEREVTQRGWKNVRALRGSAEETRLHQQHFDLVFVRWVVSFVPDLEAFVSQLVQTLKPGGIIAIQDYYYEGLSLSPHGGACDDMADVVRAYYRSGGGDAYVTGKLPGLFRRHGLGLIDFTSNCLSGGPGSPVMEWAYRFFSLHIPLMAERGVITREKATELLDDWNAHLQNPDALFFSPLVVDVAGRMDGRSESA